LDPEISKLFEAAKAAQGNAYAPYSNFSVGAAACDENGRVHGGCNVENAAYPVGTCAEAGAISALIAAGGRRITAMLILGSGTALVTPCGACRQRIREFASPAVPVHIADPAGIRAVFTVDQLLPTAFGPDNLGA
jgi:cytidine deaminase